MSTTVVDSVKSLVNIGIDKNTKNDNLILHFITLLFLGDLCDIVPYLIPLGSWYLYLQRFAV